MRRPRPRFVHALLGLAALPGLVACDAPPPPAPQACDALPLDPACELERPEFQGIEAPVEILRDASGIPHVFASGEADAFYGSGYAQAVDRLFQMELTRRRALGTRAAWLGPDFVASDRISRLVNLRGWARAAEADLLRRVPEQHRLLLAWTAGVNARIEEVRRGDAPMPEEFAEFGGPPAPWEVSDGLAVAKLLLFGNAQQIEYDVLASVIAQYLPELDGRLGLLLPIRDSYVLPEDERPAARRAPASPARTARTAAPAPADAPARLREFLERIRPFRSGGSNNWAIDGAHTESGRPLIAGDPHQPLSSPSLFWLHHMRGGDDLDVVGFSFVGTPSVQLGHNRHLAWTATTTYPDVMDLWDVRVVGGVARVAGVDVAVHTRREPIEVAGGATVELVVEEVPGHGVLLPDDFLPLPIGRPGRRILFDWTGFRVTHEAEGFHGIETARTLDEFADSVERMEIASFNFLGADASGLRYVVRPLVPDRGANVAFEPWRLLDGDDPATMWTRGMLDPARLPSSTGGARGWIASANNDPFGFLASGTVDDDPFYYGAYFDPGLRSARIEEEIARLVARGRVTAADLEALQDDTHTILADDVLPSLFDTWSRVPTDDALAAFRDRPSLDALVEGLRGWDRRMERGSHDALAYHAFQFFLARRVLADDLSLVFEPILEAAPEYVLKTLANVLRGRSPDADTFFAAEPRDVSVARALEETDAFLATRFGADAATATWGDLHGARFASIHGDRLDGGWVPTDGGEGTVNVASTGFFDASGAPFARLEAGAGAIYRMVAGFRADGRPEAFINAPRGVSGEPTSPHWSDLEADWVEHRHRALAFDRAEVEAGPTERLTLTP